MQGGVDKYRRIADFDPNPMQRVLFDRISPTSENPAILLKSPTGSGKTEAVLIPSLVSSRRLFLIFPSRSLVEDQIGRCEKYLKSMSKIEPETFSLVVDTGGRASRTVFVKGEKQETGRRHLYDGDVIITTFDKFLYRFFGFGEQKKSYIFPFRIHHSHRRNLFCFDEAHSYDKVAFTNFVRLMKSLYKVNLDLVVMTATMPEKYQEELDFLDVVDYTTGVKLQKLETARPRCYPNKQIEYRKAKNVRDEICAYVFSKHQWCKRTIATIETIEDVVCVYMLMKERYNFENLLLYHGRLTDYQRRKVYCRLKKIEENEGGYLLLTTSAIEVGCDLNAHLLVTELCNPDQLIQRAGRCNRRGDLQDAKVVVVGNQIPHFLRTISQVDQEQYIQELKWRSENGEVFDAKSLLQFIKREPHHDYRAEMLFEMLYEYVYEARLENKPLHDRGLVVTRSFEPSVTLVTKITEEPENPEDYPQNAVSVRLSQCIGKPEDEGFKVYHRFYNDNDQKFVFKPLDRGGCVYFKDLFVLVPEDKEYYSQDIGYVKPPIVFENRGSRGYQRSFVYRTKDEAGKDKQIWLHYLRDLEEENDSTGD
ncbi:CRISPR-associated helicase Cas3' [Candidatus Poribacteria bacterium]|nr:CRISPR-associated helicase Cas3' [Candidatus Poribacteria bacterium]